MADAEAFRQPDASGDPAKPASPAPRQRTRAPLSGLMTMLVIGGLFTTAALPAYAILDNDVIPAEAPVVQAAPQTFGVSAAATVVAADRDVFKATTPEELAEKRRLAALAASYSYRVPVSNHSGDDYPWAGRTGALSPLRYYYGQCVDFVAWRLNRDAGVTGAPWRWAWGNLTPGGGNADQWPGAWRANGWPISSKPVVGAVAYTGGNHVAYVSKVYGNGTVLIEEYNWAFDSAYGQRVIPASSATYLYPPG